MIAEDEEWIKYALKDYERKKCISKVMSMERSDAVGKGDNYASDIHRLKMKVVLNSGDVEERSVIYKAMPKSENRIKLVKKDGIFEKETRIFMDVIPETELIRRQKECSGEPLFPEFYGFKRRYEGLLFEDLCEKGFKMAERRKGLDFEHAELVMRSLAKYHALTAVVKEHGELNVNYYESMFLRNKALMDSYFSNLFEDLATLLEKNWKGEWVEYAKRVRKLKENMAPKIIELLTDDVNKYTFLALNHGDCWTNNMLFKYDGEEHPISLRFIDLQLSFYSTPLFDVQYFLQTSLDVDTRKRNSELFQIYSNALREYLKVFEYPEKIPSHEDIRSDYSAVAYFGLSAGLGTMPITRCPPENTVDMENLAKEIAENKPISMSVYSNLDEDVVSILKMIILEAIKENVI